MLASYATLSLLQNIYYFDIILFENLIYNSKIKFTFTFKFTYKINTLLRSYCIRAYVQCNFVACQKTSLHLWRFIILVAAVLNVSCHLLNLTIIIHNGNNLYWKFSLTKICVLLKKHAHINWLLFDSLPVFCLFF